MARNKNAKNCSTYRWHVKGQIAGEEIDKKFCSINTFLDEWGGDATPMNLDKSKVLRLKRKWQNGVKSKQYMKDKSDELFAKNWIVDFKPINETRMYASANGKRKVYFD